MSLSRKTVNKIRREQLGWMVEDLTDTLNDNRGDWLTDGDPGKDGFPEELHLAAKGTIVKVYHRNGRLAAKFRAKVILEEIK